METGTIYEVVERLFIFGQLSHNELDTFKQIIITEK